MVEQESPALIGEARLEVLAGPLEGEVLTLAEETSIGREPSNEISILDPAVSRHHCLIAKTASGFCYSDPSV